MRRRHILPSPKSQPSSLRHRPRHCALTTIELDLLSCRCRPPLRSNSPSNPILFAAALRTASVQAPLCASACPAGSVPPAATVPASQVDLTSRLCPSCWFPLVVASVPPASSGCSYLSIIDAVGPHFMEMEDHSRVEMPKRKKELLDNETDKSNYGVESTLHSPQGHDVSSHAMENPSHDEGLVRKEIDVSVEFEKECGSAMTGLVGIPLAPCGQSSKGGVYFILEKASLVAAYVGKKYQILNPDEHATFLRRKNKNPYDYRPDIVHEALLQIMGSRLCMSGRLRAIFIKTDEGILIKVQPNTQIPKTLKRFCNMIAELLQKFSIKSKGNHGKLLRLVENPVTKHLPINSRKIGLSVSSPKAVQINDYIAATHHDENLVFVAGAMAHGKIEAEYIDDLISVSAMPLSAGTCLRRICVALERKRKIL